MEKRANTTSPRILEIKKKRREILKKKIIFFFILFIFFLIGLVFLSRWQKLKIENIEISGNKIVENNMILKVVNQNLLGYYLWVIPKNNFLLYPKNKIENNLKTEFKRLENITITTNSNQGIEIIVSEHKALYTWCGDEIKVDSNEENKCYFLNENGYVFDEAPYFSGNVYFRFFGKIARDADNPSGKYFFPEYFDNMVAFLDVLKTMNIKPTALFVKEGGESEIYLSSNTSLIESPKIIFKTEGDLKKITENLQASVSAEPLKTEMKEKYNQLLYIDLRFGNKIYYKFK